jgi:hypothetical protein
MGVCAVDVRVTVEASFLKNRVCFINKRDWRVVPVALYTYRRAKIPAAGEFFVPSAGFSELMWQNYGPGAWRRGIKIHDNFPHPRQQSPNATVQAIEKMPVISSRA